MHNFSGNWLATIVDAFTARLKIQGWATGTSEEADEAAWGLYCANRLNHYENLLFREAMKFGEASVSLIRRRPSAKATLA